MDKPKFDLLVSTLLGGLLMSIGLRFWMMVPNESNTIFFLLFAAAFSVGAILIYLALIVCDTTFYAEKSPLWIILSKIIVVLAIAAPLGRLLQYIAYLYTILYP